MKNLMIISAALISLALSGCSYVTDMVEAGMTERASFSITASYSNPNITVNWDKAEADSNYYAGIEVYRTLQPNDEYTDYDLVTTNDLPADLTEHTMSTTKSTIYNIGALSSGTYFVRVAVIYWVDPAAERIAGTNGYTGTLSDDYNNKTQIDSISGYAKVVIP